MLFHWHMFWTCHTDETHFRRFIMVQSFQEYSGSHQHDPKRLLGLICSSCGRGFTSEEELRDHQVACRSSLEFLSQFEVPAPNYNLLN